MTAEEMKAIVEAVTREVLAQLSKPAGETAGGSACACSGGGCCSKQTSNPGPAEIVPESKGRTSFGGRLLTEDALRRAARSGETEIVLAPGAIVTPLARDRAAAAGIRLVVGPGGQRGRGQCPPRQGSPDLEQIAYFTARPVLTVERILRSEIEATGARIDVCPVTGKVEEELEGALSCAGRVSEGSVERAVVLAEDVYLVQRHANRLPGVRARVCWDAAAALQSRRCDDSNVLLLSSRLLGQTMLKRIVQAWLSE